MESLEVGHLAVKTREVNERINLVGEQDRLLFVNALLVGAHLDKEVGTANLASCLTHLRLVVISTASAPLALLALLACAHGNLYCVRLNGLSATVYLCCWYGERTGLVGADNISECD